MTLPAAPPPAPPPSATAPAAPPDEAATAPVVPGAPLVKQTERPHPLSPFIRGWIVFVALLLSWSRELIPDGRGDRFDVSDVLRLAPFLAGFLLLAAAVGFVSWWFTRFVIDSDELRLETGALFKSSKRVPFERLQSVDVIQPLAARLFGLAELRIEVGAGDSSLRLRYLSRARATRLREYLLARAHGRPSRIDDPELAVEASAFTDRSVADRPLVRVSPARLVGSFLISTEWLASAGATLALLVVSTVFDFVPYALPGLVPLLLSAAAVVSRRVVAMYGFTLSTSPRGLRVTRGLTNLTSQSVPVDRIQGVRVAHPLFWRPFGWYRVDVDILGYAAGDGENNERTATSVLLPVASAAEVALALAEVLPGVDLTAIELHRVPRRVRWLRWFDWWTLRYGWNEQALVTEHGWLTHVRDVLPHGKTQSVRIEQGPLQRRLRIATVHCDTPRGPVDVVARHLDQAAARALALSQLDRARDARTADAARRAAVRSDGAVVRSGQDEAALLAAFGTDRSRLLGAGSETEVFALPDPERVLRLYRPGHEGPSRTIAQLRPLYDHWRGVDVGIEVPLVLDAGEREGRAFSVDRRFSGRSLSGWLAEADPEPRRAALLSYLDATTAVCRLPAPLPGFARLAGPDAPRSYPTLAALADAMLAGPVQRSHAALAADLPEVAEVWDRLQADLRERVVAPVVVHGDVCPPNAYLSLGPAGPVVTGLGDFSPHTMQADPLMDLGLAIACVELESYPEALADAAWLEEVAVSRYAATEVAAGELTRWLAVYRRFYGFYFSDACLDQPALYAWCLRQLRR